MPAASAWIEQEHVFDGPDAADLATRAALRWLELQAGEHELEIVIAGTDLEALRSNPAIEDAATRHACTTPKSAGQVAVSGPAAVLTFLPDLRTLDLAGGVATTAGVICAIESPGVLLEGWASIVGARNLAAPDLPPPANPCPEPFERLMSVGNDWWADLPGMRVARRIIDDMVTDGFDEPPSWLAAAAIANGHGVESARRLAAIAELVLAESSGDQVWLSTKEAARRLGVTAYQAFMMIDRGELPAYKLGRVIRCRATEVEDLAD